MKKLITLVLVIVIFVGLLWGATHSYLEKEVGVSGSHIIMVKKGATLTWVASQLSKKRVIDYPRLFVKIGQFYSYDRNLKYGEYEITEGETYLDLFKKITSGQTYQYKITFVEGDHLYKYASLIEGAGLGSRVDFINRVKDKALIKKLIGYEAPSLEGYLYPETYSFSKTDSLDKIISTMVQYFKDNTQSYFKNMNPEQRHQYVTLASIVEKETGAGFERPLISSVFHNRMAKKMRLQTDPTIIYGILDKTGIETKNIRKKDIKAPTAYNTYVISGLPPGPIGNPGIEAIKAALFPKETSYLYFVSRNDGTHIFSETYKKHLKAVKKFQLDASMRKGKSWRDLNKKRNKK